MLAHFVLQFCLWQNYGGKAPMALYQNSEIENQHGYG
jgi:hypothetical protein